MDHKTAALKAACKVVGVSPSKIVSRLRTAPCVDSRMIVIILLSREGMTDEHIGWILKRSRPTVLHCRQTATDLLAYSKSFREKFESANELYNKYKSL